MATPAPLDILIDLASTASDERAKALAGALNRESDSAKRLDLLADYRRDYLVRYDSARRSGLTATALINFYHFLQKLDQAIEQQQAVVARAKANSSVARVELQEAERKRKSLMTIQDRRLATLRVIEARREQRANDEFSQRLAVYGAGVDPNR